MSGAHGNAKSSARLLCPPERKSEFVGWDTSYVHDTVTVLSSDSGTCDEMRKWSSPGSVLTSSSCTTCASAATCWAATCDDGQPRASVRPLSAATSRTTRCRPPQVSPAVGWGSARPSESPFPPSSPVASCVRPLVSTMVDHISAALGNPSQQIMAAYDTRTDEALTRLVSTLPSATAHPGCSAGRSFG